MIEFALFAGLMLWLGSRRGKDAVTRALETVRVPGPVVETNLATPPPPGAVVSGGPEGPFVPLAPVPAIDPYFDPTYGAAWGPGFEPTWLPAVAEDGWTQLRDIVLSWKAEGLSHTEIVDRASMTGLDARLVDDILYGHQLATGG